jgi:hypothetical protein
MRWQAGGWRKLHSEELHNLYSSPSIIKMMKLGKLRLRRYLAQLKKRNTYVIFVGKTEGKRLLGRRRHRWVYNIKMDLKEIGWSGMEWIGLA